MKEYDVLVIGAGSGGLTVAYTAKGFNKKVLMIDQNLPGGECTWSGCVPSKALIHEANRIFEVRDYLNIEDINIPKVLENVKKVRENVYQGESIEKLREDGIDFVKGRAEFVSSHEVKVNDDIYQAKKIFIATGSSPLVPPIPGLKDVAYFDNESFFQADDLPSSMIILGGGAIGVELGQALNRLGIEVHIIEMGPSLLPREEREYTSRLETILQDEGVKIYAGHKATKVEQVDEDILVHCLVNGDETIIKARGILVALGRKANTNLSLEKANVDYDKRSIHVNDYMETSQKGIYAVGDVAGPYLFSHMANVQGIQAVQNAVLPYKRKVNYDHVAWATFTQPELARAGLTEDEARDKFGDKVSVYQFELNELDRGKTDGVNHEGLKIITDHKGRVLGATILANRAGELIGEIQVLKTLGKPLSDMAKVIHPYPTYAEVFTKLGKKAKIDQLLNHPIVKLFRGDKR